ncbi:MAG: hypothetical protein ACRDY1_09725 [Acidimicrobiales bacterium]
MTRITKVLADTTARVLYRNAAVTDHGGGFRAIELAVVTASSPNRDRGNR